MSYSYRESRPTVLEKILSALSYIFPLIGMGVLILAAVLKKEMRPFLKYHILHSIFLAFFLFVIFYGLNLAFNILSFIPIIKTLVSMVTFYLNTPLLFGYSIISFVYLLLLVYLIFGVVIGAYSYFPFTSDIIKSIVKGQR